MTEDPAEKLTREALERFGTHEMSREYHEFIREKQRMLEEQGARITALETRFERMQAQMDSMSNGISNQGVLLGSVDTKLDALIAKQNEDAGYKKGMEAAAARTDRADDRRFTMAQLVFPTLLGAAVLLLAYFIQDIAQSEVVPVPVEKRSR